MTKQARGEKENHKKQTQKEKGKVKEDKYIMKES
jgi:hypothetical protein